MKVAPCACESVNEQGVYAGYRVGFHGEAGYRAGRSFAARSLCEHVQETIMRKCRGIICWHTPLLPAPADG